MHTDIVQNPKTIQYPNKYYKTLQVEYCKYILGICSYNLCKMLARQCKLEPQGNIRHINL